MHINSLTLSQFRVFDNVSFDFRPGMNLIIGINGTGKSTVLDALRILLAKALPYFTACRRRADIQYDVSDITFACTRLHTEMQFQVKGLQVTYGTQKGHEQISETKDNNKPIVIPISKDTPTRIPKDFKYSNEQPLAVYFSTHRSLFSPKQSDITGQAAAFANALNDDRGLRLREYADWWLAQQELASEKETSKNLLKALENMLEIFLDTCTNLDVVREPERTLQLDKDGATLNVRQLSDGERGILALVLDLARRLALANPGLDNPLQDGKAVVLIDELDLHLHPSWQRTIVSKLTNTFCNCQFIATTHSPQILGEVLPENIIILENGKQPYCPDQSLGMDSNWILEFLMGTSNRNKEFAQDLGKIADLIDEEKFEQANEQIMQLRKQIPSDPELVKLQTRLDRLQILGK